MSAQRPIRCEFGPASTWRVAITIPARNEERRILACLDAAFASLRDRGGIVVAVNGSQDATFARAQAWFRGSGASGIVLDDPSPMPSEGVGGARRKAINACLPRLSSASAIMTTDADSQVFNDWVDANLAELQQADLICGSVLPDAEEFASLPPVIARRGVLEGQYMALTLAAYYQIDPVPHDPCPSHINPAGASLAFRPALYSDLGGIPAIGMGEDRAFAAMAEARDWRIRHSSLAKVTTACRLYGRTSGGMAGALRARISEADPLVDELLRPARQTLLRAAMRAELRSRLGLRGFGTAWSEIEASAPELRSPRMHMSDLARELPLLASGLAAVTRGRDSA